MPASLGMYDDYGTGSPESRFQTLDDFPEAETDVSSLHASGAERDEKSSDGATEDTTEASNGSDSSSERNFLDEAFDEVGLPECGDAVLKPTQSYPEAPSTSTTAGPHDYPQNPSAHQEYYQQNGDSRAGIQASVQHDAGIVNAIVPPASSGVWTQSATRSSAPHYSGNVPSCYNANLLDTNHGPSMVPIPEGRPLLYTGSTQQVRAPTPAPASEANNLKKAQTLAQCLRCPERRPVRTRVSGHQELHYKFGCLVCPKRYDKKENVVNHVKRFHQEYLADNPIDDLYKRFTQEEITIGLEHEQREWNADNLPTPIHPLTGLTPRAHQQESAQFTARELEAVRKRTAARDTRGPYPTTRPAQVQVPTRRELQHQRPTPLVYVNQPAQMQILDHHPREDYEVQAQMNDGGRSQMMQPPSNVHYDEHNRPGSDFYGGLPSSADYSGHGITPSVYPNGWNEDTMYRVPAKYPNATHSQHGGAASMTGPGMMPGPSDEYRLHNNGMGRPSEEYSYYEKGQPYNRGGSNEHSQFRQQYQSYGEKSLHEPFRSGAGPTPLPNSLEGLQSMPGSRFTTMTPSPHVAPNGLRAMTPSPQLFAGYSAPQDDAVAAAFAQLDQQYAGQPVASGSGSNHDHYYYHSSNVNVNGTEFVEFDGSWF